MITNAILFLLRMHINYHSWACKSYFYGETKTRSIKTASLLVSVPASLCREHVDCILYTSFWARCWRGNGPQEAAQAFEELVV